MLLFCKKRILKSTSFVANPNICYKIYKIRKDYLCGFFCCKNTAAATDPSYPCLSVKKLFRYNNRTEPGRCHLTRDIHG